MKILYVGGTGEISFDCVHESVRAGHDVHVFNRGHHNDGLPDGVTFLTGDLQDDQQYRQIADHGFDVVCQFRVFTPAQLQRDLDLLTGKIGRYVFISSASAYQKPVGPLPITEDVPLVNPFWEYSRNKAACEALLTGQSALPWTIVRPSHTSRTQLISALGGGDLFASRLLRGKPVIVHGDGTSLWTITAAADFAPPFVKLLAADAAVGQAYHLTADHAYPWRTIFRAAAEALGVEPQIVGVPSDTLIAYNPDWEGPLWGDKAWSMTFDNRKLKAVVGDFSCDTTLARFMADRVASFHRRGGMDLPIDAETDALFDRIAEMQQRLGQS